MIIDTWLSKIFSGLISRWIIWFWWRKLRPVATWLTKLDATASVNLPLLAFLSNPNNSPPGQYSKTNIISDSLKLGQSDLTYNFKKMCKV